MKLSPALTVVCLGLLAPQARAVITVTSLIDNADSPTGIRAQAVIKEATDGDGTTLFAQSIKEFHALITIRDGEFTNALRVTKRQHPARDAWGLGRPLGYQVPPFSDPEGPWFGLVWPYRDQYDYFRGPKDPLADDVGIFFQDGSLYGFRDIDGVARGGPSDPDVPPPGMSTPAWLQRGITGNGLEGPATYFSFDAVPTAGPTTRPIQISITSASAVVVTRDAAGNYGEITVQVPNYTTEIRLPEPAGISVIALTSLAALRRRRQRGISAR